VCQNISQSYGDAARTICTYTEQQHDWIDRKAVIQNWQYDPLEKLSEDRHYIDNIQFAIRMENGHATEDPFKILQDQIDGNFST
jgi:hypothetical protein